MLRHAEIALAKGNLDGAIEYAAAGLRLAEEAGDYSQVPAGHIVLAITATRRMDATLAVRSEAVLRDSALVGGVHPMQGQAAWAVAQSVESRDGVIGAAHLLRRLVASDHLVRELLSAQPAAASWLVRATRRLGAEQMAGRVVDHVRNLAAGNERFPVVQAAAAHAIGLFERDERSLETARGLQADRWTRASILEDLGVMRSAGRPDDERVATPLQQAAELYRAVGASRDAFRVHGRIRELSRPDGWPPRTAHPTGSIIDQLTDIEFAVAELVGRGLTNKRVGQQLFMSHHTVAFHLKKIFRKLAVSSRVELASSWNQLAASSRSDRRPAEA